MIKSVEHIDTWTDYNGVWVILRIVFSDGGEICKTVKVR